MTAEQQKELEKKVWEVIPEAKFLESYIVVSYLRRLADWNQIMSTELAPKEHIN